jgi:hypothetical protein
MNCKDYIFIAHHGFLVTDDDDDLLNEIRSISNTGIPFKVRADNRYTVTKQDMESFERSFDYLPDFEQPSQNASGLKRPQGKKGSYMGVQFDSMWEYAFYRYQTDIMGHIVNRNSTEWFPYFDDNGRQRKFYYDFDDNGQPTEVKGIWRPLDLLKQQATNGQVIFVSGDDIKPMIKELNDKFPGWRDEYSTI